MQPASYQLVPTRYLIASLIGIGFLFLFANLFHEENYPVTEDWYFTDLAFIVVPGLAVMFGIILNVQYRGKGNHGVAWIFITIAMVSWLIGEMTFDYEAEYDITDISTMTADIFYILGYPLFFLFLIFYLKPHAKKINKKMMFLASVFSLALIIPSLYFSIDSEAEVDDLEMFFIVIYPILSGSVLAPTMIGAFLFFKGQVNFLWMFMVIGLLCDVVADSWYLVSSLTDTYFPGHPSDIFFLWAYVFFAFGMYSHIILFRKEPSKEIKK